MVKAYPAEFCDVQAGLEELTGVGLRLGVLTNGATEQEHAKVAALGLAGWFEIVITGEELRVSKTDPMSYLTARDRFRCRQGMWSVSAMFPTTTSRLLRRPAYECADRPKLSCEAENICRPHLLEASVPDQLTDCLDYRPVKAHRASLTHR